MIYIISSQMKNQTNHQQSKRSSFPYIRCYWICCKLFIRQFCFVTCDLRKYCFITEEIGIYLVFQAVVSCSSLPPTLSSVVYCYTLVTTRKRVLKSTKIWPFRSQQWEAACKHSFYRVLQTDSRLLEKTSTSK